MVLDVGVRAFPLSIIPPTLWQLLPKTRMLHLRSGAHYRNFMRTFVAV